MSTSPAPDWPRVVTGAGHRALEVLQTPDADHLDAVAWASAHLAAVTRALLPLAARTLPDETAAVVRIRRSAAHLQLHLRRLEQLLSGDGLVSRVDRQAVYETARDDLEHYLVLETDLLQRLFDDLGPEASAAAVAAYEKHLDRAPTRPHPHAPARGPFGVVAFWVDGLRDRVMDTMDGRHSPLPRRRRSVPAAGRWSQYLLGTPALTSAQATRQDERLVRASAARPAS